VYEHTVLRRVFGSKGNGITGCWGKLHNEELHNLYSWPSLIRKLKLRSMRRGAYSIEGKEKECI
jgi:hypothetical protein